MTTKSHSAGRLLFAAACAAIFLLHTTPVRAQSFSLVATPSSVYLNEGALAATTITVEPVAGFSGSVTLSISGLPKDVAAAFMPVTITSTSQLVFGAAKVAATGPTVVTVTGVSGSLTAAVSIKLAVSAATGTGGSGTVADLSSAYNVYGIYTNGTPFTTGGLDGDGYAFSESLLTPSRIFNDVQFNFGPANQPDAVSGTGQPIMLPAGRFTHMLMLGNAVNGNQMGQIITVTYTDGATSTFERNVSDWYTPQSYPGEVEVLTMPYRNESSGGRDSRTFYLYGYVLDLDSSKTVESLTLPDNRDLVVLAVTLTVH